MVLTTNKYSTYSDLLYGEESCIFPTDTNGWVLSQVKKLKTSNADFQGR